jgi:hypothetical protein
MMKGEGKMRVKCEAILLVAVLMFAGTAFGQQMQMKMGMQAPVTPADIISTFEKQRVLPDQSMSFARLAMGKDFYGKLISKVDFGNGVFFSVRKARILPGGDVGLMSTPEICYIEGGLGLIVDAAGMMEPKVVTQGSWFTVPAGWKHTLRNIGEEPLYMTVIRVGPEDIH